MQKIFGIGLSKTGTTSLSAALNELGVHVTHYPKTKEKTFDPLSPGCCDIPAVRYYKELDRTFPNSKFIYTVREKEDWLISIGNHLKNKQNDTLESWQEANRVHVYSQLNFDPEVFSLMYDKHDKDVKAYFEGREEDLLILNICAGDELSTLLNFIGITSNTKKFPHKKIGVNNK